MLSDIAALVTILSLVVTPIFFFIKRWYDKISERKMASKNLYGELDDTLRALDHRRHARDAIECRQVGSSQTVTTVNRAE